MASNGSSSGNSVASNSSSSSSSSSGNSVASNSKYDYDGDGESNPNKPRSPLPEKDISGLQPINLPRSRIIFPPGEPNFRVPRGRGRGRGRAPGIRGNFPSTTGSGFPSITGTGLGFTATTNPFSRMYRPQPGLLNSIFSQLGGRPPTPPSPPPPTDMGPHRPPFNPVPQNNPTPIYDLTPFFSAPAVANKAGSNPIKVIHIPDTRIPSPLADNLAPVTLADLREYLCGREVNGALTKTNKTEQEAHVDAGDGWGARGHEPGSKLGEGKMVRFGAGERDGWSEARGRGRGEEIWESWKRAWDLWNGHYIEGRVNELWVKEEYDRLKAKLDDHRRHSSLGGGGGGGGRGGGFFPPRNPFGAPRRQNHGKTSKAPDPQWKTYTSHGTGAGTNASTQMTDSQDPIENMMGLGAKNGGMFGTKNSNQSIMVNKLKLPDVDPPVNAASLPELRVGMNYIMEVDEGALRRAPDWADKLDPIPAKDSKDPQPVTQKGHKQKNDLAVQRMKAGALVIVWKEIPIWEQVLAREGVGNAKKVWQMVADEASVDIQAPASWVYGPDVVGGSDPQTGAPYDPQPETMVNSRPLMKVPVTERWDTGQKRQLLRDENVPSQETVEMDMLVGWKEGPEEAVEGGGKQVHFEVVESSSMPKAMMLRHVAGVAGGRGVSIRKMAARGKGMGVKKLPTPKKRGGPKMFSPAHALISSVSADDDDQLDRENADTKKRQEKTTNAAIAGYIDAGYSPKMAEIVTKDPKAYEQEINDDAEYQMRMDFWQQERVQQQQEEDLENAKDFDTNATQDPGVRAKIATLAAGLQATARWSLVAVQDLDPCLYRDTYNTRSSYQRDVASYHLNLTAALRRDTPPPSDVMDDSEDADEDTPMEDELEVTPKEIQEAIYRLEARCHGLYPAEMAQFELDPAKDPFAKARYHKPEMLAAASRRYANLLKAAPAKPKVAPVKKSRPTKFGRDAAAARVRAHAEGQSVRELERRLAPINPQWGTIYARENTLQVGRQTYDEVRAEQKAAETATGGEAAVGRLEALLAQALSAEDMRRYDPDNPDQTHLYQRPYLDAARAIWRQALSAKETEEANASGATGSGTGTASQSTVTATSGTTSQNLTSTTGGATKTSTSAGAALFDPDQWDTDLQQDHFTYDVDPNDPVLERSPSPVWPAPIPGHDTVVEKDGSSGGFLSMKNLPDYKPPAPEEYSDADLNEKPYPEWDDVLANSVWRPRCLGEKKLKIDIDEDIEDFFANTELEVDGGVDCGRSPYPVLRSVVKYFKSQGAWDPKNPVLGQNRASGDVSEDRRVVPAYVKKRVWDQVTGTIFNMPTIPEAGIARTDQETKAKAIYGDFFRDENYAPHGQRHSYFPLDIRRCDRIDTKSSPPQPREREYLKDLPGNRLEEMRFEWESPAMKYPVLDPHDPWKVTPEQEMLRDNPPRRYPPNPCLHQSGQHLYVDDGPWREEETRDIDYQSRYFVTNLEGGELYINGVRINKGEVAGPLPPFAVIETEGGQISFWWGIGGRDWRQGPPTSQRYFDSQWATLRQKPGWEYVGLSAGQVWNRIIHDRLYRERTGEPLVDDEIWARWKKAKEMDPLPASTNTWNQRLLLVPNFGGHDQGGNDDDHDDDHTSSGLTRPECFDSDVEELRWLITRAEPLQQAAIDFKAPENRTGNTKVPDRDHLWAGNGRPPSPDEFDSQEQGEITWRNFRNDILRQQEAITRDLERRRAASKYMSPPPEVEQGAIPTRKRKAENEIGCPDPKKVKERLEKEAAEKEAEEQKLHENLEHQKNMEEATIDLRKRELQDAAELAVYNWGFTVKEKEEAEKKFRRDKRIKETSDEREYNEVNDARPARGLSKWPPRRYRSDDEVRRWIQEQDIKLKANLDKASDKYQEAQDARAKAAQERANAEKNAADAERLKNPPPTREQMESQKRKAAFDQRTSLNDAKKQKRTSGKLGIQPFSLSQTSVPTPKVTAPTRRPASRPFQTEPAQPSTQKASASTTQTGAGPFSTQGGKMISLRPGNKMTPDQELAYVLERSKHEYLVNTSRNSAEELEAARETVEEQMAVWLTDNELTFTPEELQKYGTDGGDPTSLILQFIYKRDKRIWPNEEEFFNAIARESEVSGDLETYVWKVVKETIEAGRKRDGYFLQNKGYSSNEDFIGRIKTTLAALVPDLDNKNERWEDRIDDWKRLMDAIVPFGDWPARIDALPDPGLLTNAYGGRSTSQAGGGVGIDL